MLCNKNEEWVFQEDRPWHCTVTGPLKAGGYDQTGSMGHNEDLLRPNFTLQLALHSQIHVHTAASAFRAHKMHCVVKPSPG